MERVIAYVDGFNLYFGLKSRGWRRYYWLNVHALCENLLLPTQQLVRTRYFTSRVSAPAGKVKRQATYLEAIQTVAKCETSFGHYLVNPRTCRRCGYVDQVPTEKMTDVNIATELLTDAFQNAFDTALLVSTDSDLTAPISAMRRFFPAKRAVIGFPPGRFSVTLRNTAHAHLIIGRKKIADSQFPNEVRKADGFVLRRPAGWK